MKKKTKLVESRRSGQGKLLARWQQWAGTGALVFVAMLIYFDTATFIFGKEPHPSFYILLFLLVMRGFALFGTLAETVFVNGLISVLFILILWLQQRNFAFARDPQFVVQLVLVWLVILMGWFIMVVINQQKMDLIRTNNRLMHAESLA
ncbi:MAG: hypothetical protein IID32_01140, partial [Planctomycetes bacterium]|nr:hypothetical protein [Planctomycetota bacterium]